MLSRRSLYLDLALVLVVSFGLFACSSSQTPVLPDGLNPTGALSAPLTPTGPSETEPLQIIQTRMAETPGAPSEDAYQAVRNDVLSYLTETRDTYERQSRSPVRKTKNIISGAGVLLGLAGTAASFAVKDDSVQSTIAQASSIVAAVSGVVFLLPIGAEPKHERATRRYPDVKIPSFEKRWPASLPEEPITETDWADLQREVGEIQSTLDLLRK